MLKSLRNFVIIARESYARSKFLHVANSLSTPKFPKGMLIFVFPFPFLLCFWNFFWTTFPGQLKHRMLVMQLARSDLRERLIYKSFTHFVSTRKAISRRRADVR